MEARPPVLVLPPRVTREQAKAARARDKAFQAALKARAKAFGWHYAGGDIFRQDGEWFANAMPWLMPDGACRIQFSVKPMALDPIFWDIVGLPENAALPLSFRANGAWVLRAPGVELQVLGDGVDLGGPAEAVLASANEALLRSRAERSPESLLRSLGPTEELGGQLLALAVCLHTLRGDLDSAEALCREAIEIGSGLAGETGGFITGSPEHFETFVDQAKRWIVDRRRGSMALVGGA